MNVRKEILHFVAFLTLWTFYGISIVLVKVLNLKRGKKWERNGKILIIATFHNPGWFNAHIKPLALSNVEEVVIVCDETITRIDKVKYECPPYILASIFSRAGAKFIWALYCGFKYKPDLYIGYHIFPCALIALIVSRIFKRPACYQDTSGPLELAGGGWKAENRILKMLGYHSSFIEKLVFKTIHEFDLIVVRGQKAKRYIQNIGYRKRITIITGAISISHKWEPYNQRKYDIAFVGRLTKIKGPDRFIKIVSSLVNEQAAISAIVIGDGPEKDALRNQAKKLGVNNNISFLGRRSNVLDLIIHTKIFILPSRWEGLSIALIEAMSVGTVPIVSDVGDLSDIIIQGTNGYIVPDNNYRMYHEKIFYLLQNELIWKNHSIAAMAQVTKNNNIKTVASCWNQHLNDLYYE